MERKYKQRGYMSADKPQKKEKRPHPKATHDRNRSGRARRAWWAPSHARAVRIAARCCSRVSIRRESARVARFELHSCKQCAYFDTAARFECMKPVPERIPRKDQRNDCTFYEFRTTIEKDTAPSAPAVGPVGFAGTRFAASATPARRLKISSRSSREVSFPSLIGMLRCLQGTCNLQPRWRIVILNLPMRLRDPTANRNPLPYSSRKGSPMKLRFAMLMKNGASRSKKKRSGRLRNWKSC